MTGKVAYDVYRFDVDGPYESGVAEVDAEWPFDIDPGDANAMQIETAARIAVEEETGKNVRSVIVLGGELHDLLTS